METFRVKSKFGKVNILSSIVFWGYQHRSISVAIMPTQKDEHRRKMRNTTTYAKNQDRR